MQSSSLMVFEKDREVKSGRRKEAKFFLFVLHCPTLTHFFFCISDTFILGWGASLDDVMLYPAKLLTHSSG